MPDNIVLNVESPEVLAPITIDWGSGTFVDSIRAWLDDIIKDIRQGGDETFTTIFLTLMFSAAIIHMWRRV